MTRSRPSTLLLASLLALALVLQAPVAHAEGGKYGDKAPVAVVANKIGPYHNPTETYEFYSLPFCQPAKLEKQSHNLGEILSGDRKVLTGYDVRFKVPISFNRLCNLELTEEQVAQFQRAVDEDYYFEMLVDNLPVWGYVGRLQTPSADLLVQSSAGAMREGGLAALDGLEMGTKRLLHTHLAFTVDYNGDRIVALHLDTTPDQVLDITETRPLSVSFTYSVTWRPTDLTYEDRVERHQKAEFLPATYEIHWLSIINSFVLVLLLTVFLALILMRVVNNDFSRYLMADEEEDLAEDESGWKLIHTDVFRFPENKSLFAAVLGAGTQLLCLAALLLLLALLSVFSPTKKGAISTVVLVLYALTAGSAGYVSARFYKQLGGFNWVWNTVLTATLFPGPLFVMFCVNNSVAIAYDSTAALPFGTIVAVFAVYLLVTFPLTVMGAILGKRAAPPFEAPCRTSKAPRQVPASPWYRSLGPQLLIAGFLPFSAIYIEVHYVFSSIWGHKVYSLYGILFLAFVLLLLVTCAITVALVYFQLAAEDHRWWWRSMLYGGSTGLFVYGYSFFYYFQRSKMTGFLQTTYFFGYMLVLSYAVALMLATVGFFASLKFTRFIYSHLKLD